MPELSIVTFLSQAKKYLHQSSKVAVPNWRQDAEFEVIPLGQGEYNMNYLIQQENNAWVLRINTGSQLDFPDGEQIAYEYNTLRLLEPADIGPIPYFLDNSFECLPFGIMGMSYLPGEALDYRTDLTTAVRLMAHYHQLTFPSEKIHLIREEKPLSWIYDRCACKLKIYFNSDLVDPELKAYLMDVLAWADNARHHEVYFLNDPWQCIINTEVNNSNWIVDRSAESIHLVDWEKPLWGDPSQDLSHFRVPTTTLWKTNYRLSLDEKTSMLTAYKNELHDAHLRDTIEERTRLRDPFNCLRAVAWCALAWVQYQHGDRPLKNPDTYQRLSMYLDLNFVRHLFDPYLTSAQRCS